MPIFWVMDMSGGARQLEPFAMLHLSRIHQCCGVQSRWSQPNIDVAKFGFPIRAKLITSKNYVAVILRIGGMKTRQLKLRIG